MTVRAHLVGHVPTSTGFDTVLNGQPWADARALCAQSDPEEFFPNLGGSSAAAKALCRRCPLQVECLEWALETGEPYGIWGGMSARERTVERRRRGLTARPNPGPTPKPATCGTDSGYYRHIRTLGEPACEPCKAAHRAAERRRAQGAA